MTKGERKQWKTQEDRWRKRDKREMQGKRLKKIDRGEETEVRDRRTEKKRGRDRRPDMSEEEKKGREKTGEIEGRYRGRR